MARYFKIRYLSLDILLNFWQSEGLQHSLSLIITILLSCAFTIFNMQAEFSISNGLIIIIFLNFIGHYDYHDLTFILPGCRLICYISDQGVCFNPHRFSLTRVQWCCIWNLYIGLGPLYPCQPKSFKNVTSLWQIYVIRQNGKKRKKWRNLFLTINFLRNIWFSPDLSQK